MKITIRQSKKTWFCAIALSLVLIAYFFYLLLCDSSYLYIVVSLILPVIIVTVFAECSTKYVLDESGASRFVFGRKRLFLRWDECIYIGVFNQIYFFKGGRDGEKTFACAKTPLMHCSMKDARRIEYSLDGNPSNDISPSWKKNEAIKIPYKLIGDENYAKILELCGGERIVEDLTIDRVSHTSCTMDDAFGWTEITSDCRHKPKLSLRDCMKYEFSKNGESIYRNRRCRKCGRAIDVKNDRSVNGKEVIIATLISVLTVVLSMALQIIAVLHLEWNGMLELLWVKVAFYAVIVVSIFVYAFMGVIFSHALASYFVLNHSAEWTIAQSNAYKKE